MKIYSYNRRETNSTCQEELFSLALFENCFCVWTAGMLRPLQKIVRSLRRELLPNKRYNTRQSERRKFRSRCFSDNFTPACSPRDWSTRPTKRIVSAKPQCIYTQDKTKYFCANFYISKHNVSVFACGALLISFGPSVGHIRGMVLNYRCQCR